MDEKLGPDEEQSNRERDPDDAFAEMRRKGRLRMRVGELPWGDETIPEYVYSEEWSELQALASRVTKMAREGRSVETVALANILAAVRQAIEAGDTDALETMHKPARKYLRPGPGHSRADFIPVDSHNKITRSVVAPGWDKLLEFLCGCYTAVAEGKRERVLGGPSGQRVVAASEGDALVLAMIMRQNFPGVASIVGDSRDALALRLKHRLARAYEDVKPDDDIRERCDEVAWGILEGELELSGFDEDERAMAFDFRRQRIKRERKRQSTA